MRECICEYALVYSTMVNFESIPNPYLESVTVKVVLLNHLKKVKSRDAVPLHPFLRSFSPRVEMTQLAQVFVDREKRVSWL